MVRLRIAALTPLLTVACGGRDAPAATDGPTIIAVTVQAARVDTVRDTVVVPGQVVPSAAAEQVVTAPEAGELVEAPKAEGDTVQAGDLLARFEIASITADSTGPPNRGRRSDAQARDGSRRGRAVELAQRSRTDCPERARRR